MTKLRPARANHLVASLLAVAPRVEHQPRLFVKQRHEPSRIASRTSRDTSSRVRPALCGGVLALATFVGVLAGDGAVWAKASQGTQTSEATASVFLQRVVGIMSVLFAA